LLRDLLARPRHLLQGAVPRDDARPHRPRRHGPAIRFSIAFQSRLAGEPWLAPFTDKELERLPQAGVKRLLVICPAFTTDCLETLEEIQQQGRDLSRRRR
jgi:protoheme ferro-lyase